MARHGWVVLGALVGTVFIVDCGADSEDALPACVAVDPACKPLYDPPTFSVLYANLFQPKCASVNGTCHTARASGGLNLSTADLAYAGLSARLKPSDAACSLVVVRTSYGGSGSMPPGSTPLTTAENCAIQQWIAAGAAR